jgi:hypothetical protein
MAITLKINANRRNAITTPHAHNLTPQAYATRPYFPRILFPGTL